MTHLPAETVLLNRPSVLIIADDAEFARTVMARWQTERQVPAFTLLGSDLWDGRSATGNLAIIGPVRESMLSHVLERLGASGVPAVFISDDPAAVQVVRSTHPRLPVLRQHDGWVDTLVLLCGEILRRAEAVSRAAQAECAAALSQRYATLGRYMLDMRHSFNNAMTSVLGNAELLLLEPAAFSAQVREQVDTIHTMAIRMHEIMQRFSSLEAEMQFAERAAHRQAAATAAQEVLLPS